MGLELISVRQTILLQCSLPETSRAVFQRLLQKSSRTLYVRYEASSNGVLEILSRNQVCKHQATTHDPRVYLPVVRIEMIGQVVLTKMKRLPRQHQEYLSDATEN